MQQPPGQQGPPQQSSSLDETGVAAVKVTSAAIKSKYFIFSPVEVSLHLGRVSVPSRFLGKDQARGGGTGGRSIRKDTLAFSMGKRWASNCGTASPSKGVQKRINAEQGIGQHRAG